MWSALGETLPLAVGLTLSPFAVVTGLVLLLGRHGRAKAALFALGWAAAILLIAAAAFVIVDVAESADAERTHDGVDILQLGLGALLLGLAGLSWRKRPRRDAPPKRNALLARLDHLSVAGAFGIGLGQGLLVVKNIPLAVGAGARLGDAGLTTGAAAGALVVFAVVASLGVLVPLVVTLATGDRLTPALRGTRDWVEGNVTPISVAVLLVLGANILGQGLGLLG